MSVNEDKGRAVAMKQNPEEPTEEQKLRWAAEAEASKKHMEMNEKMGNLEAAEEFNANERAKERSASVLNEIEQKREQQNAQAAAAAKAAVDAKAAMIDRTAADALTKANKMREENEKETARRLKQFGGGINKTIEVGKVREAAMKNIRKAEKITAEQTMEEAAWKRQKTNEAWWAQPHTVREKFVHKYGKYIPRAPTKEELKGGMEKWKSGKPLLEIGKAARRGLYRSGEGLLVQTETSSTETESIDGGTDRPILTVERKVARTWPYSKEVTTYETVYWADKQGVDGKLRVKEPTRVKSVTTAPIPQSERSSLSTKNIKSVMNGADIVAEFRQMRSLTSADKGAKGEARGVSGSLSSRLWGDNRPALGFQPIKSKKSTSQDTSTNFKSGASNRGTGASRSRSTSGVSPAASGQVLRSLGGKMARPEMEELKVTPPQYLPPGAPRPTPALMTQSAAPNTIPGVPEGYSPQYSRLGQDYMSQVRRYVGGVPRVVGYLPPHEEGLGVDLWRAQSSPGMNPPTLLFVRPSRRSMETVAGFRHEDGPSHDFANQIFSPAYGAYRLRGNGQSRAEYAYGYGVLNMFLGRSKPQLGLAPNTTSRIRSVAANTTLGVKKSFGQNPVLTHRTFKTERVAEPIPNRKPYGYDVLDMFLGGRR